VGRDALTGGVQRVVPDHRTPEGRRVTAYMRALVAPFVPSPTPWAALGAEEPSRKLPATVREQARTAGRLLLEEEALLGQIAALQDRPKKTREVRRLKRDLRSVRGMRLKIEQVLQERTRRR
jgi:hypothetical protein